MLKCLDLDFVCIVFPSYFWWFDIFRQLEMWYLLWQCALLLPVCHNTQIMAFSTIIFFFFRKSFLLMFCKPSLFMSLTVRVKEVIFCTITVSTLDFESNWQWQHRSWKTGPWFTQSLVCGLDYTQRKVTVDYQKNCQTNSLSHMDKHLELVGFWNVTCMNVEFVPVSNFAYWCGKKYYDLGYKTPLSVL